MGLNGGRFTSVRSLAAAATIQEFLSDPPIHFQSLQMRLSRFFIDAPLSLGEHDLPEAQAHYIGRVLRMAAGDAVQLFDGSGQEYLGQLLEVGKKTVRVQLNETFAGPADSSLKVHLGQGLSRGERMDWAIQKATELGANIITPIVSERCEVRLKDERADKRLAHWRQVAISACEQCGRSSVPQINPPVLLADWLKACDEQLKLVLHPVAEPLVSHQKPDSLAFLIGPEGGLSEAEVEQAKAAGFQAARLGPRVLRTETAPVVALAVAQQLWGDF
ncbi:Ribosomal RNA small subunit methyltransferase E [compost metagenome]